MSKIRIEAVYKELDIERLAAALVELTLELEARKTAPDNAQAEAGDD